MKQQDKSKYRIYIDSAKKDDRSVVLQLVTAEHVEEIDKITGQIDFVTAIRDILTKHDLKPDQVDLYDFNPGPGSFTGLKTGSAIANVMNWALGKIDASQTKKIEYGGEPNIQTKQV